MGKSKAGNDKYILTGLNLTVCFLVMGVFIFYEHFSVDDYSIYFNGGSDALHDISSNLRPVNGSLYFLLYMLGINVVKSQRITGVLLIVVFAWIATIVSLEIAEAMKISQDFKKIFFVNAGTLIFLVNASLGEYLYFSAAYMQWMVSMAGAALAGIYIGREGALARNWILGFLALVVTAGSYQPFIAHYVYIVMSLIFVRNKGKFDRKSFWLVIRAAMTAILALVVNICIVRLLMGIGMINGTSRMNFHLQEIPKLIVQIIAAQKSIWIECLGMYPRYLLGIYLLAMLVILYIGIYKKKADISEYLFAGIVLISGYCVMWAAMIMQGYISVLLRMLSPVFGIYAVGIWMICFYFDGFKLKLIEKSGFVFIFVFFIFSSMKIGEIAVDTKISNSVSQCFVQEISNRIEKYENENGIAITKAGFCSDAAISYRYYQYIRTEAYADICRNPFSVSWSGVTSLNYYSGREFAGVEVPEDIQRYYVEKNWDTADWDEQLYFNNDTVYICVF